MGADVGNFADELDAGKFAETLACAFGRLPTSWKIACGNRSRTWGQTSRQNQVAPSTFAS